MDFWGRLRKEKEKHSGHPEAKNVGIGEQDAEEEEDEASVLDMASRVDLSEIESVLRNDRRYRVFAHVPEQRTAWIREHLMHLSEPKQTIHQFHIRDGRA